MSPKKGTVGEVEVAVGASEGADVVVPTNAASHDVPQLENMRLKTYRVFVRVQLFTNQGPTQTTASRHDQSTDSDLARHPSVFASQSPQHLETPLVRIHALKGHEQSTGAVRPIVLVCFDEKGASVSPRVQVCFSTFFVCAIPCSACACRGRSPSLDLPNWR